MRPTSTKMTYDEYCLLPDDRNQHELFDGELVMTPSPTPRHQEIVTRLAAALHIHVQKESLGKVYVAPLDTILDQYTVLQPDLLFISRERLGIVTEDGVEGSPDLVAEVLSPATFHKDLRRKLHVYSLFGVQEYWIVDPETRTIELHCRGKEGLELARRFSAGEAFQSQLLPGFQMDGSSIF